MAAGLVPAGDHASSIQFNIQPQRETERTRATLLLRYGRQLIVFFCIYFSIYLYIYISILCFIYCHVYVYIEVIYTVYTVYSCLIFMTIQK